MAEDATVADDGEVEEIETEEVEETEAEESEVDETESDETDEDETESEENDEDADEEVEVDEFNFGGNKVEIPKGAVPEELKQAIQKFSDGTWADYTKGKQDLSERAKTIEARESAVEKFESLQGESLENYSHGLRVKAEIEQLSSVDLNELWQSDPDQARRVSDALSAKQAEFQSIVNKVAQSEQALTKAQEDEISRRKEEGRQLIERRIKGFNEKEVVDYAIKAGINEADAGNWSLNPVFTEMAHKAMLYDRAQAGVSKPKPKPAQAKPVKAIKPKGKATAAKDIIKDAEKMSSDEWLRKRNAQIAKRAGR